MSKTERRAIWMGQFEVQVLGQRPDQAGHIDWHTATHLYNVGTYVSVAVERYIETLPKLEA